MKNVIELMCDNYRVVCRAWQFNAGAVASLCVDRLSQRQKGYVFHGVTPDLSMSIGAMAHRLRRPSAAGPRLLEQVGRSTNVSNWIDLPYRIVLEL